MFDIPDGVDCPQWRVGFATPSPLQWHPNGHGRAIPRARIDDHTTTNFRRRVAGVVPSKSGLHVTLAELQDNRKYPRAQVPVYCRPARFRSTFRLVRNMALGGVRIYADEAFKVGRKLELDLLLPEGDTVTCLAEVAWSHELGDGDVAPYDIGLRFLKVPAEALEQISRHVLQAG